MRQRGAIDLFVFVHTAMLKVGLEPVFECKPNQKEKWQDVRSSFSTMTGGSDRCRALHQGNSVRQTIFRIGRRRQGRLCHQFGSFRLTSCAGCQPHRFLEDESLTIFTSRQHYLFEAPPAFRRRSRPPSDPLRVIGIDDWAWRRNHRDASIVCNLERRRIVTLLPDREPATAQAWLAAHPTIAIVSRDRGGGYGEAAAKALPHAVQVADRCPVYRLRAIRRGQ
jgi:hypothetical protein